MKPDITVFWKEDYINNGNFADGSDYWQNAEGVSIQKNVAHFNGSQANITNLWQLGIEGVGVFLVTFEITNYEAGTVRFITDEWNGIWHSSNGIFYEGVACPSIGGFSIQGDADFIGDISNISMTQMSSLPLYTAHIKEIENLKRSIEDDLFTFKSDDISFVIKNKEISGYFNPEDFKIHSDRIYRLDMTFHLQSGDKLMRYFADNDGSSRSRRAAHNYITVTAYELSTLFTNNGWYLGDVTQDENENAGYKFSITEPTPLNDIISSIQTETKRLIAKHKIPLETHDLYYNDMNLESGETYSGQFHDLEGKQIIDYVITDESWGDYKNRVFLLVREDADNAAVYEISNGELKLIHTWEVLGLGVMECKPEDLAWIHHNEQASPLTLRIYRIWTRTSGDQFRMKILWFEFKSGELELKNSINDIPYFINNRHNLNKLYIMSNGLYSGNGSVDNHTYIYDNQIIDFNDLIQPGIEQTDTIVFSVFGTDSMIIWDQVTFPYETITTKYAETLTFSMYRFIRYIQHVFNNHTVSDIIKELCILQDNIWYLDYDDGVSVIFEDRKSQSGITEEIDTALIEEEGSIIKKITFDNLNSEIFTAKKDRMLDLIYYFTGKYGNGKNTVNLDLSGHTSYHLGDRVLYESLQYMINGEEYEDSVQSRTEIKKRTYLDLFEVLNAN